MKNNNKETKKNMYIQKSDAEEDKVTTLPKKEGHLLSMIKETRNSLERYAPPGIPLASEKFYYKFAMMISTLWSMQFLIRYVQELNNLYYMERRKKIWAEDIRIVPFEYLTDDIFSLFGLVFIYTIIIIGYHYFYHYQGSKMMYLMKRLPDKWEVHKRCWTLPMMGFGFTILYMLLLRGLYYVIYLIFTPQRYLPF